MSYPIRASWGYCNEPVFWRPSFHLAAYPTSRTFTTFAIWSDGGVPPPIPSSSPTVNSPLPFKMWPTSYSCPSSMTLILPYQNFLRRKRPLRPNWRRGWPGMPSCHIGLVLLLSSLWPPVVRLLLRFGFASLFSGPTPHYAIKPLYFRLAIKIATGVSLSLAPMFLGHLYV